LILLPPFQSADIITLLIFITPAIDADISMLIYFRHSPPPILQLFSHIGCRYYAILRLTLVSRYFADGFTVLPLLDSS